MPFGAELRALKQQLEDLQDRVEALKQARAYDRERIDALEAPALQEPTERTKAQLDALAAELIERAKHGQKAITYEAAAGVLGVSESMVCKLRHAIASDPRFNIRWHPQRRNKKVISLKKFG